MFVIPCKFAMNIPPRWGTEKVFDTIEESYVVRCVKSIHALHPDIKILVVDSDSDDLTYLEYLEKLPNVIVADAKNKNYLDGAIWYAVDKYPDEKWYCLLQDSITLKRSFDEFIKGEEPFYALMWFPETLPRGSSEIEYIDKMFDDHLKNYNHPHKANYSFVGCWGPCFVAKKEFLMHLKKNNLNLCLPHDKFGSNVTERLWGMCLEHEGIDLTRNNIDGNYLSIAIPRDQFNSKTKYHTKVYAGRN